VPPDNTVEALDPIQLSTGPITIEENPGTGDACDSSAFMGYVDEVTIVTRAVDAVGIQAMYNGTWMP
jgi:hypothetical protein